VKTGKKLRTVVLSVIGLAVVAGSVFIAVTRHEEYGWWSYLVPVMAVLMLVGFVLNFLPKRTGEGGSESESRSKIAIGKEGERPASEGIGTFVTGGLIVCALVVLGGSLVVGIAKDKAGLGAILVLGLFFVVFLNIFHQFLKDHFGAGKKIRKKRDSSGSPPRRTEDGPSQRPRR